MKTKYAQESSRKIGDIANYEGDLLVCKKDGSHFLGVEDGDGCFWGWEQIPETLFYELNAFEDSRALKKSIMPR